MGNEVVRIMDNLQTPCIAYTVTTLSVLLKLTIPCMQRGSGKHLSELSNWVAYTVTTQSMLLNHSWLTPSMLLNQGGSKSFERIERLSSVECNHCLHFTHCILLNGSKSRAVIIYVYRMIQWNTICCSIAQFAQRFRSPLGWAAQRVTIKSSIEGGIEWLHYMLLNYSTHSSVFQSLFAYIVSLAWVAYMVSLGHMQCMGRGMGFAGCP